MDDVTALILADSIDDCLEEAEGLGLAELKELVEQKLAEQRVAPEVLADWRLVDEKREQEALAPTGQRRYDVRMDAATCDVVQGTGWSKPQPDDGGSLSPLLLPPTPTTRRRKVAAGPMLGDKVLALRQLAGPERRAAERRFLREARGFVRSVCAWYRGPDLDDDDVEQTATAALWSAVVDWDDKRAPFDTHARWRMRGALAKLLRASRVVRGNDSGCFVELDEETATLGYDPESELLKQEAAQEVVRALALLPERQRHVIAAVVLSGQVLAAYAAELGITVKVARKLLAYAKDAMAALVLQIRRGAL